MESRASVVGEAAPVPLPPSSRYRIIGPLSAGESRQLYLAEEIESARRASLEVFDVRGSPELEARFQQEAHLAARSFRQHPGIAAVCEWGQLADGRPYIVSDDVEGPRLGELLRDGSLGTDRALSIAFHLAGTVESLHNAGFVHKRLRPAVVILGDAGTVKLAECHLASMLDALMPGRLPSVTSSDQRAYAAPEQLAGRSATERSDLYSLALILLEMLRGRPPKRTGDGRIEASEFGGLPAAIARILTRALESDPERRPTDASAFANDLYAARASQPGGVADIRPAVRSRLPWAPSWVMVGLVLLVAIAAATLAVTGLIGARSERVPRLDRAAVRAVPRESAPDVRPEQPRPNMTSPVAEARSEPEPPPTPPVLLEPTQDSPSAIPDPPRSSAAEARRQPRSVPTPRPLPDESLPERASANVAPARRAPATPRSPRASDTEVGEPDPGAIIDWLLEKHAGKRHD